MNKKSIRVSNSVYVPEVPDTGKSAGFRSGLAVF